jgi:outer membrane protein OmpA-like peptidoglycan-associated protein/uncharacterized protein YidB (DUF937 family)
MALFNPLIGELNSKFTLGGRAAPLVAEVLRSVTSDPNGGLSGFLDRLRGAGLGDIVATWVAPHDGHSVRVEPRPITPSQLEQAVGPAFVHQIASKLGTTASSLIAPVAFVIPKIIALLTPHGTVPATLPADARSFLAGSNPPATPAVAPADSRSFVSRYWWVLGLIALLAIAAYLSFLRPDQRVVSAPGTKAPVTAPAVSPAVQVAPTLSISNSGGQVRYGGVVHDEQTRSSILASLKQVFGESNILGSITVDANARAATWLGQLSAALEKLKLSGTEALFEGEKIFVGGEIPEADRTRILQELQSLFGSNFTFTSLYERAEAAFASAKSRTLAALAALRPNSTSTDLVNALNLAVIRFETGSAVIDAESRSLLQQAAEALKGAPAGTRLEIGGHTDSTGTAATNLPLSQQRADAVRAVLIENGVAEVMLVTRGYGDTRPVASNDTADGRFQNRRIEFVVIN